MAKQQEPKPENVKDFIVVVTANDYDAPTEIYTFHGTYRRACRKAEKQFLEKYPWYAASDMFGQSSKVIAIAREAQFGDQEAWHFDKSKPYGPPHITAERW